MDATSNASLPSPQANDSTEVQTALTAAQNLWAQDPREALRWLRKAAEGASDAGDDLRSVQLARAAADLRNVANLGPSMAPPGLDGTPAPNFAVAARSGLGQNPAQTVPATPAAAAAAAAMNSATEARTPAAAITQPEIPVNVAMANFAAAAASNAAAFAQAEFQPLPVAPAQQPSAEQAAFHAAQQAAAFQAAQQAAAQQAAAQQAAAQQVSVGASDGTETGPVSSPPSAPHFVTHRSVRVALSPTPNSEGEFSVHPLGEGESAPPGWKDALLVALEPGERLFPGRN